MTTTEAGSNEAPRCAVLTREQAIRMVGSAGSVGGYLMIEWPLPWPSDIGSAPGLDRIVELAHQRGVRLQAVRRAGGAAGPAAVLYTGTDPFRGFRRWEAPSTTSAVEAAMALLEGGGEPSDEAVVDILVCAHGSRDVCCGSSGTKLIELAAADEGLADAGVRLWRTSHTGGHRFAPTAISLPDGMVWGQLDIDVLRAVALRQGDPSAAAFHLRGCSGLAPAAAQALDAQGFRVHGWEWLGASRRLEASSGGQVTLTSVLADGTAERWDGMVSGRTLPLPECRAPLASATKTQIELTLEAYRVTPQGDTRATVG